MKKQRYEKPIFTPTHQFTWSADDQADILMEVDFENWQARFELNGVKHLVDIKWFKPCKTTKIIEMLYTIESTGLIGKTITAIPYKSAPGAWDYYMTVVTTVGIGYFLVKDVIVAVLKKITGNDFRTEIEISKPKTIIK